MSRLEPRWETGSRPWARPMPTLAWVFAFLLLAGCASTWSARVAAPGMALDWPLPPRPARVSYLRSISGFAPDRNSGTILRSIVYGADSEEQNAFVLPVAVATASDGRIAVADLGRGCVHLFLPGTRRYVRIVGTKSVRMVSPVGVAFDDGLRLYVADSSGRLFAFGADATPVFTLEAAGPQKLQRPTGLAYSPRSGLLYVVDTLAHVVHAVRPDGSPAFSFGGRGEGEGQFNFPTHVFRSGTGELFVTDALNFRIAVFDEEGKFRGSFGHHGDGSGDMALPKGVAVDRAGVVYVVDAVFDNLQLFTREGGFLLTVGERGTGFGEFWLPSGLFLNDAQELYVCDTYNHRVQVFRVREGGADAPG